MKKTFKFAILICIMLTSIVLTAKTLFAQANPNSDPNWNWRTSQYTIWFENETGIRSTLISSPGVAQGSFWSGLLDNNPEDGWVLVARDFGSQQYPLSYFNQSSESPWFILYNKYRGLLRFFIHVRGLLGNASSGSIQLKIGNGVYTSTLTHLRSTSFALDKKDSVKYNTASALNLINNGQWAWGDFPMAYDPTIIATNQGSELEFTIWVTTEGNLRLKGIGSGVQGGQAFVRDFLTGGNGAVSISRPTPSVGSSVNFDDQSIESRFKRALGTQKEWAGYKKAIKDMHDGIETMTGSDANTFFGRINNGFKKGLADWLNLPFVKALPSLGIVAGLVDFFFGGGKNSQNVEPTPTFFGFNLELTGTLTTTGYINRIRVAIPKSKIDSSQGTIDNPRFPIIYNKHLGIINLTKTPILQYKTYYQGYSSIGLPSYPNRIYWDFRVKEDLQYQVNPDAGLQLDSLRVWIVADITRHIDKSIPKTSEVDLTLISKWIVEPQADHPRIRIENLANSQYVISTIPTGENGFRFQTIRVPDGIYVAPNNRLAGIRPNMLVKVQSFFHRTDSPESQPITFVHTFEPDFENAGNGNWSPPSPPPPPPAFRVVNLTKTADGGIFNNQSISQYSPSTTITVPASENFGGHNYVFQQWSDGSTALSRTITAPGTFNLTAEYKGFRLSNIPELAGKSGGSRTVAIDASNSNYWYQVYESNNAIWLSYSTNAGASWQPEVKLGDGKNPSIAGGGVVWVYGGIYFRTVGFLDGNLNLGSTWSSNNQNPGQPGSLYIDPIPDAHPCIAYKRESDGSWSYYIVYEHRIRQGFTTNYPNTELRLIRLGWTSSGFGVKSLHTIPNSFYTQSYLSLYPAIATDNSSNPNVNTPATIVWQNYVPTVSDGIKVCEANLVSGSLVFGAQHTFAPSASTVHYQKPTIVLDASNHRHIAWQALDHSHPYGARTVILYKVLPSWNDPSQPLTKFLYYDSKATPSIGFANGTVSLVWDYSGGTCFGATRSTNGTWGAWQSFFGEAPNLMQKGAKQIAHAKANGGLFDVKLTSLSGGGGSAQERGLSGGGKGNGVQAITNSGSGGNDNGSESISVKARTSTMLFKENEVLVKTAWLDLTLADVGLNGSSRTGLTYHDLGANLLPDTLALSPSNVFSLLKSRKFSRADTINQVSATVKAHSKSLYDLTQNNPVQLAVELVNATAGSSIALSQTALVTASDTAKEIHFTMNLPTGQAGTEVELRVKVLGFAIQPSHKASALNEIELVSGAGGTAIVNRVGNQAAQTETIGSVPTKFALHQNYPNPFNPVTVIRYELPSNAMVKLQVFDVLGRVVATVVNERKEAGIYEAMFNASSLSSGTYFYRLEARSSGSQAGSFVETKKMVLVK